MRRSIVAAAIVAALLVPVFALAHTGHVHKVMGTVSVVSPTQLEVKTTDGKTAVVLLNAKTVYEQGTTKADLKALKVGDRVVIEGTQATGAKNVTAQKVRIGTAPATAKK
jgi:hypothetical protein